MLRAGRYWLAATVALALGACASTAAEDTDLGFGAVERASKVTVENRYTEDMDIYVLNGSARMRLGRASSFSTMSATIPADVLRSGRIALEAVPIGPGREFRGERMLIQSGQFVRLRLERNLALSNSAVWIR
jgi:hypothetical protein